MGKDPPICRGTASAYAQTASDIVVGVRHL
jgi:hypothetical protein